MSFDNQTIRGPSRRAFVLGGVGIMGLAVSGCSTAATRTVAISDPAETRRYALMYGPMPDEQFPIPGIDVDKIPPRFRRQRVDFNTTEKPGTIVVNTSTFYLHFVEPDGKAMRYGVGLGRAGFEWSGRAIVGWKRPWPTWTPPSDMIARQPELQKYSAENGGMQPGLDNPLGARALYIFQNNKDTLYRIHGTPEYWTIGKAVSSGCVRMINQDVIDLYTRVPPRAPILVI